MDLHSVNLTTYLKQVTSFDMTCIFLYYMVMVACFYSVNFLIFFCSSQFLKVVDKYDLKFFAFFIFGLPCKIEQARYYASLPLCAQPVLRLSLYLILFLG